MDVIMRKIIPYYGEKMLLKGLILKHRSKVISLVRIFSRALVAKSRSHDNSLAGEYELKYTAWMANQDVELSDEEYKKAIKHHFEENDHHLEHFTSVADTDLSQLMLYLADTMARVTYSLPADTDTDTYIHKVETLIRFEIENRTVADVLVNTAKMIVAYDSNGVKGAFEHEPKAKAK